MPPPPWICVVVAGITISLSLTLAFVLPKVNLGRDVSVAFIGNSILFVNDAARFLEALGGGHVSQNSCLHGNLTLATILNKGNGMYEKWQTDTAKLSNHDDDFSGKLLYDFGACTVPQLLLGYDDNLDNDEGYLVDDGFNPCLQDGTYIDYWKTIYDKQGPPSWDYVIFNDNTKVPPVQSKRDKTMQALEDFYVPYLLETGATPILMATYGYQTSNMTELGGNVPNFTSLVYHGYRQYAALLQELLPDSQQPRIAPVGLAFLSIWEEDYSMWEKLFFVDDLHPSPHGSYLMGCVLYHTVFGHMPPTSVALPNNVSTLWSRARRMQIGDDYVMDFPTYDEAVYLYNVAERVARGGHKPASLIEYD